MQYQASRDFTFGDSKAVVVGLRDFVMEPRRRAQEGPSFTQPAAERSERHASQWRVGRSSSAATPFWITLAVAAVLAGGFVVSFAESPPAKPAKVVLVVDGLR